MEIKKPRRVFTMKEYRDDPGKVMKEAKPYGHFKILNEEGKVSLSVSSGPTGITCKICDELPEWCANKEDCVDSWRERAVKAENKLRSLANQLENISQEMFW